MSEHFAFVIPAARGHVTPTLPLMAELRRRGHRVTCATGQQFVPDVTSTGASTVALSTGPPPPLRSSDGTIDMAGFLAMARHFNTAARDSFPVLAEHFTSDRPDTVCFETRDLAGRMLVDALDVPGVSLVPTLASNERFSLRAGMVPADFDPRHPELAEIGREMDEFVRAHGLRTNPDPATADTPDLNIVFIPRRFQICADGFDDRFRFIGPEVPAAESREPTGGRPLLFVSLGTVFNRNPRFFRTCAEAFRDTGWDVAIATGENGKFAGAADIPGNVEVRSFFPQDEVLARADAFLSHAGMNSLMDALCHQIPVIAVPQMPEQVVNAKRVEELGLGLMLCPNEITAGRLRGAVSDAVADEEIKRNLGQMRAALDSCGGAVEGADALERHLDRSRRAEPVGDAARYQNDWGKSR